MTRMLCIGLLVLLALLPAACSPGADRPADTVVYTGPVELELARGETQPGTTIQYVSNSENGAQISVDGQTSTRRIGDSLMWEGEMVPGAAVELSTRLVIINDREVTAGGTVRVEVANAHPEPGAVDSSAAVRYRVPVAYQVDRGDALPGTTIVYEDRDGLRARLRNLDSDGLRGIGDQIAWSGRLTDRVWLKLDLRVVLVTANMLSVAGTADVLLGP